MSLELQRPTSRSQHFQAPSAPAEHFHIMAGKSVGHSRHLRFASCALPLISQLRHYNGVILCERKLPLA
jgi:hypothetical protein